MAWRPESAAAAGELAVLGALLPTLESAASVVVGPGDDCAVLDAGGGEWLLAAVDSVVGDIHFDLGGTPPGQAGAKLLKRNLSDIAAMGGEACWALTALNQSGRSGAWIGEFFAGLKLAARQYQVALVGGDYSGLAAPGVSASLTILGRVGAGRAVTRGGARPGDRLFVTGVLGDTLASGHHLDFEPRLAEGRWLAEQGFATAMLDVSDGLALDAARLGVASGVRVEVDLERLPCRKDVRSALGDGEDYELFFAVAPERAEELVRRWPFGLRLTEIGRCCEGEPGWVNELEVTGYEHGG